jgi:hypothetical protein
LGDRCFRFLGRWNEAKELVTQVEEKSKRVLGTEYLITFVSIGTFTSMYHNQDRWKEAEERAVQVIETVKRVLGVEHPETLTIMANTAYTWQRPGRDAKALKLMVECVIAKDSGPRY